MAGRAGWRVPRRVALLGGLMGLPVVAAQDAPPVPNAAPSAPLATPVGPAAPAPLVDPADSPRPAEPRPPAALPPIPRSAAELPSLEADPPGALARRETAAAPAELLALARRLDTGHAIPGYAL